MLKKSYIINVGILFLCLFSVNEVYSQVIKKNIIDLRTKQKFGKSHVWQFKPGDSVTNANGKFLRANELLAGNDAIGWIQNFPVQLSYTRYRDVNGQRPFKKFKEFIKKYKGYAWYRTTFKIRKNDFKNKFKSDHVVLRLGKIGQADAVYLNGYFIGSTGLEEKTVTNEVLPDSKLYYDQTRIYKIPRDLLHFDKANTIAVRTYSKYNISPGMSHGKYYIGSDRKIERSIFWDDFKKIFVISLTLLLGIFYLYWQFVFREEDHATFYFALGSIAMAANTLMRSQIIFVFLKNALWIKKLEYITIIAVVHLILDFIIKFSRVENSFIKKVTKVWNIIGVLAILAIFILPDLLIARRFMFAWGVLPLLVLANLIYLIIAGRKTPAMGTVAFGLFGMVILFVNDILVGFQYRWVTWETSMADYAFAIFGMSVAGSIVVNMVKRKELVEQQKKEKERLSKYFSPDVMETIIGDEIEMGGEEKPIATLFADIAGFTSYSEKHKAEVVVDKLNMVFEKLSGVIFEHGATLDKYIGDCIMAFWGAPKSTEDDAYKAVSCAVHMQKEIKKLKEELGDKDMPFTLRIGVNYGKSIVGNIGSKKRMDYTVIGDAVNTASRIESNGIPGKVAISEATYKAAGGAKKIKTSEQRSITVKGKTKAVKIYVVEDVM